MTPPCGVPHRLGVTRLPPFLSSSTIGARSHALINLSTLPSLTLRATCRISSPCGIVSKYFDRSASMISVFPCRTASTIPSMAWWAFRLGLNPWECG